MFGTLGGPELFLILVVALIVFGPRKLPEIGKSLGRMMNEFKKASNEFRQTLEDEVEADKRRETARIEAPVTVSANVVEPATVYDTPTAGHEHEASPSAAHEATPDAAHQAPTPEDVPVAEPVTAPAEPTVSRDPAGSSLEPK
jgi:TatA/E family protein of Tat protein translocase